MDSNSGPDIVILGAGNVGCQLGKRFIEQKLNVVQVYNRTLVKAQHLAGILITDYTDDIDKIDLNADIYIICVSDNSIEEISSRLSLKLKDKLVVHTSGAISSLILSKYFKHYGVFYPLQSFSGNSSPDFSKIPVCIFAKEKNDIVLLIKLGNMISNDVEIVTDEQRLSLHFAAVLVNNFTNHLYSLADNFLKAHDLNFRMLLPLIEETVNKVHLNSPFEMQTGPAKRGDLLTIYNHLELIKDNPELQKIYLDISKSINPHLKV